MISANTLRKLHIERHAVTFEARERAELRAELARLESELDLAWETVRKLRDDSDGERE